MVAAMKTTSSQTQSLLQLLNRGGWEFNTFVGITCVRFSLSLARDLLWYAGLPRKIVFITLLSSLLWATWLHRPWAK